MRIQIADDVGNLLYVPALNAHLERDLRELFPKHPGWRVLRNRYSRRAHADIDAAIWQLRLDTRHAVGEPGEE